MAINLSEEIKIDTIESALLSAHQIELGILRLDQIHPIVSGNKWYKLKYNIAEAIQNGYQSVLTFGGSYSNHLIATASAAKVLGLASVGLIRGLHSKENYTETLHACENMGMQLHFITRTEYDQKETATFLEGLHLQYPDSFIIPEGGNNEYGRKGTTEIAVLVPDSYTHVALPVGTGATFAGIRTCLNKEVSMLGFAAMKGGAYLEKAIRATLPENQDNWSVIVDYHFGGFAKCNDVLIDFMNAFYHKHNVPLDRVYTAKMLFGVMDMITQGKITNGSKVLCIHTGGLQGNASIQDRLDF
jgi:1-aminocyclopropane-1-carboxylate deaminase